MASAKQGVKVLPHKKGITGLDGSQNLLIAVKKTGYYNFSVNGKSYYCDERIETNTMSQEVLVLAFNGGSKASQKKKKGTITVTHK